MAVETVFAVIAEGTRRDILEALATEHKAVGQLVDELGVSQPTVSKHLRVLREAGVVTMRAQGQKRFYSINTEPLSLVAVWLDGLGAGVSAAKSSAGTPAPVPQPAVVTPAVLTPAVVNAATVQDLVPVTDTDPSVQAQISRGVGRAANKAADLLSILPTFRRRKD